MLERWNRLCFNSLTCISGCITSYTFTIAKPIYLTTILIFTHVLAGSQPIRISGYVRDSITREVLVGAFIYDSTGHFYTTTDRYGYFSMSVPTKCMLTVSYVGYQRKIFYAEPHNQITDIALTSYHEIDPVIVKADNRALQQHPFPGTERIVASKITQLPSLLGDPDITRTLQTLPGVNFSTENSTGYYVHGGNFDQNLILIDHIPIYQASHMFGMLSIFNSATFNSATLYKGAFPSNYGGRVASVLDISMRNGNKNQYSGEVTASSFASRVLIEGPLVKNKTSFILTARRSMLDIEPMFIKNYTIFLTGMNRSFEQIQMDKYRFYDYTLKINHSFSQKSMLSFSYIRSYDAYPTDNLAINNSFRYSNQGLSLQWHALLGSNLSSSMVVYRSAFSHATIIGDMFSSNQNYAANYLDVNTNMAENAIKWQVLWSPVNHQLQGGIQLSHYTIEPLLKRFTLLQGSDTAMEYSVKNNNFAIYLSDEYRIGEHLTLFPGIRIDYFTPQIKKAFIQPRLSVTYRFNNSLSSRLSYCETVQPFQQIVSQTIQTGNMGIWIPSQRKFQPLTGNDIMAGIEWSREMIRINIETYYKTLQNLITLKEGVSLLYDNINLQQQITGGQGKAMGIEISIHKDWGKTTGWIGYHLSSAQVKFEQINEGKPYAAPYDRTHTFTTVVSHKITQSVTLGAQWLFATGIPVRLYNSRYYLAEPFLGTDNSYLKLIGYNALQNTRALRFPAYHRLDVNITYTRRFQNWSYELQSGAYNAYSRVNAYKIFQNPEGISYIGLFKIVPYFSLSVKF